MQLAIPQHWKSSILLASLGRSGGHLLRNSGHLAKCASGDCCDKTITSFTISGVSGCCSVANGTYAVNGTCTEDTYNVLLTSSDDGCSGCPGDSSVGLDIYRFTAMSLDVLASINPTSGAIVCSVTINWEVYEQTASGCEYYGPSDTLLRFTRNTCDSGSLIPPSPGIVGNIQPGNCFSGSTAGSVVVV